MHWTTMRKPRKNYINFNDTEFETFKTILECNKRCTAEGTSSTKKIIAEDIGGTFQIWYKTQGTYENIRYNRDRGITRIHFIGTYIGDSRILVFCAEHLKKFYKSNMHILTEATILNF